MIKGTPDLIAGRREEIVNACEQLYRTMSFREITLKEIGKLTSYNVITVEARQPAVSFPSQSRSCRMGEKMA